MITTEKITDLFMDMMVGASLTITVCLIIVAYIGCIMLGLGWIFLFGVL